MITFLGGRAGVLRRRVFVNRKAWPWLNPAASGAGSCAEGLLRRAPGRHGPTLSPARAKRGRCRGRSVGLPGGPGLRRQSAGLPPVLSGMQRFRRSQAAPRGAGGSGSAFLSVG
jgi:hypothetical protein